MHDYDEPLLESFFDLVAADLGVWIVPLIIKRLTKHPKLIKASETAALFTITLQVMQVS